MGSSLLESGAVLDDVFIIEYAHFVLVEGVLGHRGECGVHAAPCASSASIVTARTSATALRSSGRSQR